VRVVVMICVQLSEELSFMEYDYHDICPQHITYRTGVNG